MRIDQARNHTKVAAGIQMIFQGGLSPIPSPSNSLARCRERVRGEGPLCGAIVWRAAHPLDQKIKERSLTRRSKTSVDLSRHRERQFKRERVRVRDVCAVRLSGAPHRAK